MNSPVGAIHGEKVVSTAGVALLVGLCIFLPSATFPLEYHNDEPSKVLQIQTETRNLCHPVLMLDIADAIIRLRGVRDEPQKIAETGRTLSGLYSAGTAALLAAAVTATRGSLAGLAAAVFFLISPETFEISNYFKEDALHLFTLSLLGLCVALRPRHSVRGVSWFPMLSGLALGLAISSKYYTWGLLPAVVILVYTSSKRHRLGAVALALAVALGFTAALHLPWLWRGSPLQDELKLELVHLFHGHYGVGIQAPHTLYVENLLQKVSWIALPLVFWSVGLLTRRGKASLFLIILTFVYLVAISFLPKYSERYLHPVLLAVQTAAGCGLADMARYKGWFGVSLSLIVALLALIGCGFDHIALRQRFQRDDRAELAVWISNNLPDSARFAIDAQALMQAHFPDRVIISPEFLPEAGSIENLRLLGVTHVIVVKDRHHRYTDLPDAAAKSLDPVSKHRRDRYLEYFREGKQLWASPCQNPKPLRPGLSLIAINEPSPN